MIEACGIQSPPHRRLACQSDTLIRYRVQLAELRKVHLFNGLSDTDLWDVAKAAALPPSPQHLSLCARACGYACTVTQTFALVLKYSWPVSIQ